MKKPKRWSPEWWKQIKTTEELIKALLEPVHEKDEKKKKVTVKKPPK